MSRLFGSIALATAASLTAGVLVAPGAAHAADTTVQLSAAGMTAALKAVSTASVAAARKGWRATMTTDGDGQPLKIRYVVDRAGGVVLEEIRTGKDHLVSYGVADKGLYMYVNDPKSRSAVAMMGRPSVRYVFLSKALKLDDYVKKAALSPEGVLAEGVDHPGTKTSHDDGSVDYTFKADAGVTAALHVDEAGALTSVRGRSQEIAFSMAYRYGSQHVTPPSAKVTVDAKTLGRATAYLSMPASVKSVAEKAAANTRAAADGRPVKVASLRTIVRRTAAAFNRTTPVVVRAGDVSRGARVSATNPWTHRTVSYAVTASGRTVLVEKG